MQLKIPPQPRVAQVACAAAALKIANPEELDRASLQRRYDRKYVLRASHVADVVSEVSESYRVVLARDERFALYDTVYFDTPALDFYHAHRRGQSPRFKLRIRNYLDRSLSMLEYKEKTPRGDTRKLRWQRPSLNTELSAQDREHFSRALPKAHQHSELVAQARTVFYRLMLLGTRSVERATLDFNLVFERGTSRRAVDDFVVVEVKDNGRGGASPLVSSLRQHQARVMSFSKYCVAVAIHGGERDNAFRPSLRAIEGSR